MKSNINKDTEIVHECTGCQICAAVCSTSAISIQLSKEGFYEALVNDDLCINCGMCVKFCYKYDSQKQLTKDYSSLKVYAATTKNDVILRTSTSGGISSHLIDKCLEQGYKVVGVSYDYLNNIAVSEIIDSIYDTDKFKGSKYMQSYTENAFKQIIKDNKEQKYAVFGTPCQIYALNKWAVSNLCRDRFLFIDLFCHGCPSINLWIKYLEYIKDKMRVAEIKKIEFRSKIYGWHEFHHTFYGESNVYTSRKSTEDPFFAMFFDNYVLNKSCYKCLVRSSFSYTDIRLGDFWGSNYDANLAGVSAVVCCTDKGNSLFESIKGNITVYHHSFGDVVKSQSYGKEYIYNKSQRDTALRLLASSKDMGIIYKEYLSNYPFKQRIKRLTRIAFNKLPVSFRSQLRRIYHRRQR